MILYRNARIKYVEPSEQTREVGNADGSFDLTFSSEEPYRRWFGDEILSHKKADVDLSRLNDSAAVLVDHFSDQIGVVKKARIKGKRGHANIKFGNTQLAKDVKKDVQEGIRKNVSVGYVVKSMEKVGEVDGVSSYRVNSWQPLEVSIVAVAADPTIGVGRGLDDDEADLKALLNKADSDYSKRQEVQLEADTPDSIQDDVSSMVEITSRNQDGSYEGVRISNTTNLKGNNEMSETLKVDPAELEKARNEAKGEQRNLLGKMQKAAGEKFAGIALKSFTDGDNLAEFAQKLIAAHNKNADDVLNAAEKAPSQQIELNEKELKQYCFATGLKAVYNGEKSFETDISEQIRNDNSSLGLGGGQRSFSVPMNIQAAVKAYNAQKTMNATTGSEGGFTVETEVLPMIDILRNMAVLNQLGIRELNGLQGNLSIPRKITASVAAFLAETAGLSATDLAFNQLLLSPKRIGSQVNYSKQLLLQSNEAINSLVTGDMGETLALEIDNQGLQGDGTGSTPTGIVNTSGVGNVTFTTTATWPKVVEFETTTATANALRDAINYVTTPAVKGAWKTIVKESGQAIYLWGDGDQVNGYPGWASNQVAGNLVIFGNFRDLILANWGVLDITVDDITLANQAEIRVIANHFIDFGVRQAASFTVSTDAGNL